MPIHHRKSKRDGPPAAAKVQCIEIVHWREAQPTIPDREATWVKLYTSLLEYDAWGEMDDSARVLIISLWLYAARTGHYVLPADPKWIKKKIPSLNSVPDLRPLLEARDALGRPTPFLRYCEWEEIESRKSASGCEKTLARKTEKRQQQNREEREEKREDVTLRVTEEKEKKRRTSSKSKKEERIPAEREQPVGEHVTTEQTAGEHVTATVPQTIPPQSVATRESERIRGATSGVINPGSPIIEPETPKQRESEVGGALRESARQCPAVTLTPPHPAYPREPTRLGAAVDDYRHWLDFECVAFGYEVFELLRLRQIGDPDGEWGKGERGSFTRWLFLQRRSGDFEAARDRGLHIARDIAKSGLKSARKPGAVWLAAVQGRSRSPPAAAKAG